VSVELARASGAVAALGLALVLAAPARAWRLGGLAAWALGCAGLLAWLLPDDDARVYAAGAAMAATAGIALAAVFLRWPWLLPLAVLACAPARITVSLGGEEARLLVPLYAIAGAAALALAWQLFWEMPRATAGAPWWRRVLTGRGLPLGSLALPLALLVAWLGLGLLWTDDPREGAIFLLCFVLPFGILTALAARLPWRTGWATTLYGQLALMAVAFAALGIWQYAAREVFWNPKVIVDNAYAPSSWFYRVNSVFFDPSLYGRFLVVAILASLVLVLFGRGLAAWAALGLATVTWLGLVPSFSQSSYVALGAGIVVALGARWSGRALVVVSLAAAALAGVALATPEVRDRVLGDERTARSATSGRSELVANGIRIARERPATGVGTGGFVRAYADRVGLPGRSPKAAVSHTAPVTVAAENGLPGLVLLAWLALVALVLTLRRGPGPDARELARLAVGLALLAILVHSLFYDSLFEDPGFWLLLCLAAAATREPA
jgi:O-antigen ligase